MDLRAKVEKTLKQAFPVENILLDDDQGISGIVVSKQFRGISALDRQKTIHHALRDSPLKFTKAEKRRILAIAALTPAEFAALGPAD